MKLNPALKFRTSAICNCTKKLGELNQNRSFLCVRACVHAHAHVWVGVLVRVYEKEGGREKRRNIFLAALFLQLRTWQQVISRHGSNVADLIIC